MNRPSVFLLATVQAAFLACGGDSIQAPPPPPPPPPVLSFGPIAGAWAGWAIEGNSVLFWVRMELGSSALRGTQVGTVEYGVGDPDDEPDCGGNWFASSADESEFEVLERITFGGGCPDGTVRLVLDPETGMLDYEFTPESGQAHATGTLVRGTDPESQP